MRTEFAWSPEEADRAVKHASFSDSLTTDMHEVIGHASGRQAAGKENPRNLIKEHFSALEEGRADLIGLYFLPDQKLVELGIIAAADQDTIVRAEYSPIRATPWCSCAGSGKGRRSRKTTCAIAR